LKVKVLKAIILSSENHHYIQSSSQTSKFQALSLYLLDLLFRICLLYIKQVLRNLFDQNQISSYKVYCNSQVYS